MQSEDLFISAEKVTVDYVFHNNTDKDVSTIVAFPMPEIAGNPDEEPAIPDDASDNFLGFTVTVDGKPVTPSLDQHAFAVGIDITGDLKAHGVPLFPFGPAAKKALAALPDDLAAEWTDRGIVMADTYDDGSGWKTERVPFWTLRSTYWWRMTFPAGKDVHVSHRYRPSVGGTAGLSFFYDGKFQGETYADYKRRYCMDDAFERAVVKAAKTSPDGSPPFTESRIAYVLKTGGNWAKPIGDFRMVIDKGAPENLVSFCANGVKKIGPTRFGVRKTNWRPDRDLSILILKPLPPQAGE
jgi:hypothetical protein